MNTISDSLIEKLEELYPKPKAEVETVKEEPVVAKPLVSDYVITTGGTNYGSYAVQSTNSGLTFGTTTQFLTYDENSLMIKTVGNTDPLPIYVQKIAELNSNTRVAVLDRMMIKESAYSGSSVNFKQYIDDRTITPIFDLEFRMKEYIRQEIEKLKCSPGTPT